MAGLEQAGVTEGKPKRRLRTPARTSERKRHVFLAGLADGLSVTGALAEAKLSKRTAYDWRQADSDFAADWGRAIEAGTDKLEDECLRRAARGWDEPVFYQGRQCGKVRKHSDTLLIFMLKARRPGKYAPRPDQVPVNLTVILQQIANHSRCLPGDNAQDITPTPELLEAGDDTLDVG